MTLRAQFVVSPLVVSQLVVSQLGCSAHAAAVAIALLLVGCDSKNGDVRDHGIVVPNASVRAPASAKPQSKPAIAPPLRNVLLITIDSMRSDMPWNGYHRPIAPMLTKLADESVVYTRAYAVSSYTAKSVGAMLSGRLPSTLYRGGTFFTAYSKANLFFPEILQDNGVVTIGGHAHKYFDRGKNLRQGFDVWKLTPGLSWNSTTDKSITAPKMTAMAIEILARKKHTDGQFFAWFHYMDPHDQYLPHPQFKSFGKRARDLYDGEMLFTDHHVAQLLAFCKKQSWWKNTVLIISADHGESFGEHKQYRHAFTLWDVVTHVPMLISGPGIKPRRIEERRSQLDLAPTILELMHPKSNAVVMSSKMSGESMVSELYGKTPNNREPILLDLPADTNNPPTRAILFADYKLIEFIGKRYQLYNLKDDPGETRDLSPDPKHKTTLNDMRARFDKAWAKHPYVLPYGGNKLITGKRATGPMGP